jgi:hypothetical protein
MLINLPKYEFRTSYWGCLTPIYRHQYVNELNEGEHVSAFVNITYGSVEYMANGDICSVPIFKHLNMFCKEYDKSQKNRIQGHLDKFNLPILDTFIFTAFVGHGILKTFPNSQFGDKKELYLMNTDDLIEFVHSNEIKKFYIIVENYESEKGEIHYAFEDLFLINLWEPQAIYYRGEKGYTRSYNDFVIYYFEFYN